MKRAVAFLLVWLLCFATAVSGLVWMPLSAIFGSGRRALRIAVGFDRLGNATGAGDEDEPFSARCWRLRHEPRYEWWRDKIDRAFLFLKGQSDHCKGAFEAEKARRARPYVEGPAT